MSTDAKALYNFLTASKDVSMGATLGQFSCDYLELDSSKPVEFGQALLAIQGLAFRVSQQINEIGFPLDERNEVYRYFSPFQPLLDYTSYRQNMQWARQQFLTNKNVQKLLILDAVIAGRIGHAPELNNLDDLQSDIEDLVSSFVNSDLEQSFKNGILKRLLQIQSALKNYEVFGAEIVINETARVLGSVTLYNEARPTAEANRTDAVSKLRKFGSKVVSGISKSRDLIEDLEFLSDAGAEATAALISDMSDRA